MLFDLANLPYWILLGIGVVLFLLVIISGGGDSDLDIDADADVDADLGSWEIWGWLGFGQAPLILLLATDLKKKFAKNYLCNKAKLKQIFL